jgi:hypothetical protein
MRNCTKRVFHVNHKAQAISPATRMQDHRKSLIDTMEVFNHPSAEKKSLMG